MLPENYAANRKRNLTLQNFIVMIQFLPVLLIGTSLIFCFGREIENYRMDVRNMIAVIKFG